MTRSEIIAIQTELGVQADGIWGPITAAFCFAACGLMAIAVQVSQWLGV